MTLNTCDPCCNPEQMSKSQESFRSSELRILCQIRELLDDGGGGGVVSTIPVPPTGVVSGRKVVAVSGTPEALIGVATPCRKVDIQAEIDNTGIIVIGSALVVATQASRTGIALRAGQFYSVEIDDASKLYANTTVNGDGVTFSIWTN
jgi:hypothetical protein